MTRPAIIPDRVVLISLGVRGDDNSKQVKHALNVLEREGFRAGLTSDETIAALAAQLEDA